MFQFGGFAFQFASEYPRYVNTPGMGCPIRTPADQRFFAAPRGFSQLSTSFIATVCQGIHRVPFYCFVLHGLHNPQAALPPHNHISLMSSIYLDQNCCAPP